MLSSKSVSTVLNGRPTLIRFMVVGPSKERLALDGRSKTLNEGSGGFSSSSKAFPDDFRRAKVFGSLMGIDVVVLTPRLEWPTERCFSANNIGSALKIGTAEVLCGRRRGKGLRG